MRQVSPNRPTIAIVPRLSGPYAPAPPNVIRLIEAIDAFPLVLPLGFSLDGLEQCAGLFLQGGNDVLSMSEALRGEAENAPRDLAEYAALQRALQFGIPVVGVCRGMQLINSYFGGTDARVRDTGQVLDHGSSAAWTQHEVFLDSDSVVTRRLGVQRLHHCSSHHDRAVKTLGLGLRATGWASDGTVEALEGPGGAVMGVQWHPEDTAESDAIQARLVHLMFIRP